MGYTNVTWDFLRFWIFGPFLVPGRLKNRLFFEKMPFFWTLRLQKWAKKSKSQKIPSNVCITHKMGLLYQKRGFKSELEPKWNIFQKWRVEVLSHFSIHFRGKQGKNARRGQLWRVVSRQPLWIEAKVSPFWKLDIQGYNIHQNERKFFQNPKTPLNLGLLLRLWLWPCYLDLGL